MSARTRSLIPAGLIALSLVPAIAGVSRLHGASLPIALHVTTAIVFSILGALQFAPALRTRPHRWHRIAGRIALPCGFVVALTGLWMAQFNAMSPSDGRAEYLERIVAGAWMLASLVRGVLALARREYQTHGEWLTRAYAIGLGAGTQVITHLPWFLLVDMHPAGVARAIMMGAGWAINAVVAEWAIRSARSRRAAASAACAITCMTQHPLRPTKVMRPLASRAPV